MPRYANSRIAELALQLKRANLEVRTRQLDAAEAFLRACTLDGCCDYPTLYQAITQLPCREATGRPMPGRGVVADLVTLIEEVSGSLRLTVDSAPEPVLCLEQVMERLEVSVKTIGRWRRLGLVARRFSRADGRSSLGFYESAVTWFENARADVVARGRRFSQLTARQRDAIIEQARLARTQNPAQNITSLAASLAQTTGRSIETIRYTLRRHDRTNPQEAIFRSAADHTAGILGEKILSCLEAGDSPEKLAQGLRLPTATVLDLARSQRLLRLYRLQIRSNSEPAFNAPNAAARILCPEHDMRSAAVMDVPTERSIFRQYNFRKHRFCQALRGLEARVPADHVLDGLEEEARSIVQIRNWIVSCNLGLVYRIVRLHVSDPGRATDAISEGSMALLRCVDRFDYRRENRFSTYAGWAIMRAMASTLAEYSTARTWVRPVENETLAANPDLRSVNVSESADSARQVAALRKAIARLPEREQIVLLEHFGLAGGHGRTLEQIGQQLHLSKERVRQIRSEAMDRLRALLATGPAAAAGV